MDRWRGNIKRRKRGAEHPELGQGSLRAGKDAVLMEYTQARVKIIEVTPATEKQFTKHLSLFFLKLYEGNKYLTNRSWPRFL